MQVFIVSSGELSEGSDVLEVFAHANHAIAYAKDRTAHFGAWLPEPRQGAIYYAVSGCDWIEVRAFKVLKGYTPENLEANG